MCEHDDRNKQALFILETEWGCGRIDVGRIKSVLRGTGDRSDCEEISHARPV